MSQVIQKSETQVITQLDDLANLAEDVLKQCQSAGATQAEVAVSLNQGLSVQVRMGDVETIEHHRDRGIAITVYIGQRKGSAQSADLSKQSVAASVAQACAIAKYTEEDPCAGLADAKKMATAFPSLDLWHPWDLTAEEAIAMGIACETAGRDTDAKITNSDGVNVSSGSGLNIYANTHGFTGKESQTRHTISCSLIAENSKGMQRDYWYDSTRAMQDLSSVTEIGQHAARRALRRLDAQSLKTRQCPVLFTPEVARGLIGNFISAISGGALYRKASFLVDHLGKEIFPTWMQINEVPHLKRGHGSSNFDAEGVATTTSDLVTNGVLTRYVLGSYSARKLEMETTGNAGGVHNVMVKPGHYAFNDLIKEMHSGLIVTELMGQGLNLVTGDYSRGAAGFWVEQGEIAYPVEEITIAGNLRIMLRDMIAVGNDVDPRSHILTGSILVAQMTVAGMA